jgi:hypothetical protein
MAGLVSRNPLRIPVLIDPVIAVEGNFFSGLYSDVSIQF